MRSSSPSIAPSLMVASVLLLGLVIPAAPGTTVFAAIGAVALIVAGFQARESSQRDAGRLSTPILLVTATLVGYTVLINLNAAQDDFRSIGIPMVVLAVGIVSRLLPDRALARRTLRTVMAIVAVAIVVWIYQVYAAPPLPEIDVLDLHESAAAAIRDRQNPYEVATAVDTNPFLVEERTFVGYPYPPLTLAAFAGASLSVGDARAATAAALSATVILVIAPWSKLAPSEARLRLLAIVLLLAHPMVGHVVSRGWTDLLALPFLAGSLMIWRTRPVLSAILLGLAFSTKQYFVVALPLLVLHTDSERVRRAWTVIAIAIAVHLPIVLVAPGSLSVLFDHLGLPARPDSLALVGLGIDVPGVVGLLAILAVSLLLSRSLPSPTQFVISLAAVLAVVFLMGSQAFINYWLAVYGIVILGIVEVGRVPVQTRRAVLASEEEAPVWA